MTEPLRILQIVTYMGRGGLETMLMNYYRHIDRSKVQFDFLVHRDFEADYDQEIRELGGRIYHVSRLIPWSRKYRNELKQFFKDHPEYRIVHVHQDCLGSVALQCAKECGIPVRIAHSHSSSALKDLKYPIKLWYMRKIPAYATHLLACGKQAGDWMFSGSPYEIIKNAIDTEKYEYSPAKAKEVKKMLGIGTELTVGHVGNFTLAKNHTFLIDIFQALLQKRPDAKLVLVGGDYEIEAAKEKVNRLGLNDHVMFLGIRSDVRDLMQAMDVFVFPSLYEGLPVTMIEEQAAGIPAIISDHVSDECVVTKNLVTVMKLDDSAEQWADCILKRAEEGKRSHRNEIIAAGYDIASEAEKLENFYLRQNELLRK